MINFLHTVVEVLVGGFVPVLEIIGIIVILIGALKAVISYIRSFYGYDIAHSKIELAESLALGLEFKMGAEILKTVQISTFQEITILGAIILLRVILTFVIHWEIKEEHKNYEMSMSNKKHDHK